jgi:predicted nucleotide-binding protein (sugar kinase/HSP70/actin superfamily)
VTADVLGDIRSVLSVAAVDREAALRLLDAEWQKLLRYFEGRFSTRFSTMLSLMARRLAKIPLALPPDTVPVVSLVGEIYVRRDEFSRKNIVDYIERQGFAVRVAPVAEYLCYCNYVVNTGLGEREFTPPEQMRMHLTSRIQEWWEWRIKSILAQSGLYRFEMVDVEKTIEGVRHLLNVNFRGEAVLTVGLAMREILHDSCGVISIGPFGCMPSRVSEAVLKKEMNVEGKKRMPGWEKRAVEFADIGDFPFLSIETDGLPFPQLVEANLEAFVLQARRLHEHMRAIEERRIERRKFKSTLVKLYDIVTKNAVQMLGQGK